MISKSKKIKSGGSILFSEANDRFDPACVILTDLGFLIFMIKILLLVFAVQRITQGKFFNF